MEQNVLHDLETLNRIAETLNRAIDVRTALQTSLEDLIKLLGLQTGWVFLKDPSKQNRWAGPGYHLVAHHNLPKSMGLSEGAAWNGGCDCQAMCNKGKLVEAYNEVRCSRLASVRGDKAGLTVHASIPLKSGVNTLGILNIAAHDWDEFTPRALSLLTHVGNMMGIALERARLHDLLQERRIHEQVALLDLSNQLLGKTNIEDLMNDLVEEVQRLLQMDACALLLPDAKRKRLTFWAVSGWRYDPIEENRWMPADENSGPGWVFQTQRPLLVEDLASGDPIPWTADWLRQEGFRGHAVVPLVADGHSIGVLVVDARQPRSLREDEVRLLRLLANQAAIALERTRLYQEDMKRQRLEEELAISQRIQLSLLPRSTPTIPGWEFSAIYKAARQVGGDFYDFFTLPGDAQGIVIADVADKGVPAALFMALSRTLIRSTALSGRTPAEALQRANEMMLNDSQSEVFLTVFYAMIDPITGEMFYSNAGHNPPLWYHSETGEFSMLKLPGLILGVFEEIKLHEEVIQIEPQDLLILYTDGVTEAMSATNEEFGLERLYEAVRSKADGTAYEILRAIVDSVNDFTLGVPQSDDFTLLVIKRLPEGKKKKK